MMRPSTAMQSWSWVVLLCGGLSADAQSAPAKAPTPPNYLFRRYPQALIDNATRAVGLLIPKTWCSRFVSRSVDFFYFLQEPLTERLGMHMHPRKEMCTGTHSHLEQLTCLYKIAGNIPRNFSQNLQYAAPGSPSPSAICRILSPTIA